ncbi:MAG: hypothetical protein JWN15_2580 [Firmicutes bacterium]|nr:hypothetical protein [Bacillota bacterium]
MQQPIERTRYVDKVVGRTRFVGKVTEVYDLEAVERTERFVVQCVLQQMPVLSEVTEASALVG